MEFSEYYDLYQFILILVAGFMIGLTYQAQREQSTHWLFYAEQRTFLMVTLLGYILYKIDLVLYIIGLILLCALIILYYFNQTSRNHKLSFTTETILFICYNFSGIVERVPGYQFILIVILIVVTVEKKATIQSFGSSINRSEIITIVKFTLMFGVILPLIPNQKIVEWISITPYQMWVAVLVISGLSYSSYLVQRYLSKGLFFSGILGGLYSSTATTIVLSRKSKQTEGMQNVYAATIIMATGMKFGRIWVLALIFNPEIANKLLMPAIILTLSSALLSYFAFKMIHATKEERSNDLVVSNPLEIKVAILFSILFALFATATHLIIENHGAEGLFALAGIVGVTDIDPFILGLLQGDFPATDVEYLAKTILLAMLSNNIIKSIYVFTLANVSIRNSVIASLLILTAILGFMVFW